ncbi:MAG: hypothetical protein QM778_03795 [Myxococcales bacterium]
MSFTSLALGLSALLLSASCAWHPEAKPVQPQLLLKGPVKIDRILDQLTTQRFVLLTRDPVGTPTRAIFERATKKVCDLPPNTVQIDATLFDPTSKAKSPAFLIPVIMKEDTEDRALYYSDEHCVLRGPFGRARSTTMLELDGGQQVSLVGNGRGTLTMVNPWTQEVTLIAEGVSALSAVRRPTNGSTPIGPQTLWLIENSTLTQRTLQGELLFSRGQDVRDFSQALFDTLRVAYVDGNDLYEAAGPDFQPVRIAQDACEPVYSGLNLDLYSPCAAEQLVRIDLTTGESQSFEPGTFANYQQSGYLFEYIHGPDADQFYATPPGQTERMLVEPMLELNTVQVVNGHQIVGFTEDDSFVLWDAQAKAAVFTLAKVGRPIPFLDMRDNEVIRVFPHDIADRRGTLSLFNQTTFEPETLGSGVPTNAFSVELLAQVSEAAIVYIEDATQVSDTDTRLRGKLHARLVSGELGAVVDNNVTTYTSVYTPLEGLVYSVEDGERSGLWFAAL